jgi:histidinol-phosphate phosphatase family protein
VSDRSADRSAGGASRRAVFLDPDGTLIDDLHYISRPELVVLRPGAPELVRALNDAGIAVVVVTNQSGIARGLVTEEAYQSVRRALDDLLARQGARLDATYHCPHHPEISGPCDCRKPGTLLYERAARDLALDPRASAFVGDRWRDVQPALHFGGRGILVPSADTPADERARAERDAEVATSLREVRDRLLPPPA